MKKVEDWPKSGKAGRLEIFQRILIQRRHAPRQWVTIWEAKVFGYNFQDTADLENAKLVKYGEVVGEPWGIQDVKYIYIIYIIYNRKYIYIYIYIIGKIN